MSTTLKVEYVPVDKIDISEENVRFEDEYHENTELQKNIERQGLLQDVVGRWDGDRFKLIIGRDRFYAMKDLGMKEIPAKVTELKGYEAIIASLSENALKREIDPVLKARAVKRLVEMNPHGLAGVARDTGIAKSTLSEWMKILELDSSLLKHVKTGDVAFREALKIARKNIPLGQQQLIAEIVDRGGPKAFRELMKESGVEKRGAPKGYYTIRFNLDPRLDEDKHLRDFIEEESQRLSVDRGLYIKGIVKDSLKKKMLERRSRG